MKPIKIRILAVCVALSMLLCGCTELYDLFFQSLREITGTALHFDQMEYSRPDVEEIQSALEDCADFSATAQDFSSLEDKIGHCFRLCNDFYTDYNLASIHYYADVRDIYWEQENDYCMERAPLVSSGLEELYYVLAECPFREELEQTQLFEEGFFDDYLEGEAPGDAYVSLQEREAELLNEYYDLNTAAQGVQYYSDEFFEEYGKQMGDVFVEMVKVRQDMATEAGYDSYLEYAYDYVHGRDYTPAQGEAYLQEICRELVSLYVETERGALSSGSAFCTPSDAFSYVESCVSSMGDKVKEAFDLMVQAKLYDITYSENKYDISFEVFLPSYNVPYLFVSPGGTQWDKLTFAHEFGHFCNDYASQGSMVGVDVAEVFSQSMEYLSLCCAQEGEELEEMKMMDSLRLFVEQSAYALFEHQVYALEGEELTAENVYSLYKQIGTAFGFEIWGWDSRDFVLIDHFFSAPLYIISYVVSNDVALQVYQLEQEETGAGIGLFEENLDTQQTSLLAFTQEAGLKSPFEPGRLQTVRKTLEDCLT